MISWTRRSGVISVVCIGVLIGGCASKRPLLIGVPVGVTCMTVALAATVASRGQAVAGDPATACVAMAERAMEASKPIPRGR